MTERVQANSDQDLFKEYGIGGLNPTGAAEWRLAQHPARGLLERWRRGMAADKRVLERLGLHSERLDQQRYQFYKVRVRVPADRVSVLPGANATRNVPFPAESNECPGSSRADRRRNRQLASWLSRRFDDHDPELHFVGESRARFLLPGRLAHQLEADDQPRCPVRVVLADQRKVRPAINLRLGHDTILVIPEGKDQDAPLPPNFATSFPDIKVERGLVSKYLVPWDKTNIGPRIGIAYRPFDRSVFRIGYGIFYGGEENQGGNPNRGEGVPFNQTQNLNLENQWTMNPFLTTFTQGWPTNVFNLPANISFRTIDPNFRNPMVHKWNFTIQQELGWNTALEVGYIGSHGAHQVINWDSNAPNNDPRPGIDVNSRRPQPFLRGGIQRTSSFGRSNYHGLAAKLEKRYSSGLDFTASYTWGHVLADTDTPLSGSTRFRAARRELLLLRILGRRLGCSPSLRLQRGVRHSVRPRKGSEFRERRGEYDPRQLAGEQHPDLLNGSAVHSSNAQRCRFLPQHAARCGPGQASESGPGGRPNAGSMV